MRACSRDQRAETRAMSRTRNHFNTVATDYCNRLFFPPPKVVLVPSVPQTVQLAVIPLFQPFLLGQLVVGIPKRCRNTHHQFIQLNTLQIVPAIRYIHPQRTWWMSVTVHGDVLNSLTAAMSADRNGRRKRVPLNASVKLQPNAQ